MVAKKSEPVYYPIRAYVPMGERVALYALMIAIIIVCISVRLVT